MARKRFRYHVMRSTPAARMERRLRGLRRRALKPTRLLPRYPARKHPRFPRGHGGGLGGWFLRSRKLVK